MSELKISRGSVSMSLRDLMGWGIVSKMHIKGERKEYYSTEKDVWTLLKIIGRERKKRELDPTIGILQDILDELSVLEANGNGEKVYLQERLTDLLDLVQIGDNLFQQIENLSPSNLIRISNQLLKLARREAN